MLTKQKGDVATGFAISYFLSNGYEVCLPIGDKRDYDIIVEKNSVLSRVQVKYGGLYPSHNNTCRVALRITGGNQSYNYSKKYADNAFETLFIYTAKGEVYIIPWSDVTARNEIFIEHPKYAKYRVTNNTQG